jgi:hypothetical protein
MNARDTEADRRAEARVDRWATRTATSPEEIVELRNKIAGHLNRITTAKPVSVEPQAGRSGSAFAGILSGETRLQEPPRHVPFEGEPPSYGQQIEYRAEQPPNEAPEATDFREPYRHNPETRWQEEPAAPSPAQIPARRGYGRPDHQGMLSSEAAAATQAAFNQLAEALMSRAMGERSVEEVTRELLRTMLKQWLDENLPQLVERLVREEIERVARRGPHR